MRKFNWSLNIGLANADRSGTVEIDDDEMSDDQIEELIKEEVFEYIDWGFKEEK